MAIGDAGLATVVAKQAGAMEKVRTFLSRYFYLCMSLVMAGLVVWGFSRTVDAYLFHAKPRRPLLLWMHGAAFSIWIVFFIAQSALVRVRKVSLHRTLGWFGAALAAVMVVLGVTVGVVMARFDAFVLQEKGVASGLSISFIDMAVFGTCMALAIAWRKKPDYHRRLIFIGSCMLMDAALGRFHYIYTHNLFYPGLDGLIVLGMLRDLVVDRRIHKTYLYALPLMMLAQGLAVYLWRVNPAWWQGVTRVFMA